MPARLFSAVSSSRRWSRTALLAAVTTVAATLSVAASPAVAHAAAKPDVGVVPSPPTQSVAPATGLAAALASAQATGKQVEDTAARTATTSTFANPDGTATVTETQLPTRVKQPDGSWANVNLALTSGNGGLVPTVSPTATTFSAGGTGPAATVQPGSGQSLSLGWDSTLPTPTVSSGVASYALGSGETLQLTSTADGFDDRVLLASAPSTAPTIRIPLTTTGLTPSLNSTTGALSFTDSAGDVVAASSSLMMWDAATDSTGEPSNTHQVQASLVSTSSGTELDLTPSMSWLTAASTQYPVTIDPDIYLSQLSGTWVNSADPDNTSESTDPYIQVGSPNGTAKRRGLVRFASSPFMSVPSYDVLGATLNLWQSAAPSCTAKEIDAYLITTNWSADMVDWNHQPSVDETTNGYTTTQSFNTGTTGCPTTQAASIDVTNMAQAWITNTQADYGIELRAPDGTDSSEAKTFCSMYDTGTSPCNSASHVPTLSMTYVPDALGLQSSYSTTGQKIDDLSSLKVNNGNGNAVVEARDFDIPGAISDLKINRYYNSADESAGAFGPHWRMSVGPDVALHKDSSLAFSYQAPSGTWFGPSTRPSTSGSFSDFGDGIDAKLIDNGDGTFTLTYKQSQEQLKFSNAACGCATYALVSDTDRYGNTVSYAYTASTNPAQLSSITDTLGDTITPTYTSGVITQLKETGTDGSTRIWHYGYTAGQLTSATDPNSAVTNYSYDTNGELNEIQAPAQSSGSRPTTMITTNSTDSSPPTGGLGQVRTTEVDYYYDATHFYAYKWNYSPTATMANPNPCPSGEAWQTVTDPRTYANNYCIANNGNVQDAYDPLNDHVSATYNSDNQPLTAEDADNESNGSSGESTVNTYDGDGDPLTSTEPGNGASGESGTASAAYTYDYPGSDAARKNLPTSDTDAQEDCTAYRYNPAGALTTAASGVTSGCTGTGTVSTGNVYSFDHNPDGTFEDQTAPTGSGTEQTTYDYYPSGNADYHQLKDVIEPNGSCSGTRTLCTSYTYDPFHEVLTTTDGKGNQTTDSYDPDGRTTQVLYGTGTCTPSSGNCIKYTYDGDGNLLTRVDATGTTTYAYDLENRSTSETLPGGSCTGTVTAPCISYTYDGDNNLTGISQTVKSGYATDTTTYGYNNADQLTSVTDAAGTFNITVTNSGKPKQITVPTSTSPQVTIAYTRNTAGRTTGITTAGGTSLPSYTYSYKDNIGVSTDKLQWSQINSGTKTYYLYDDDRLCWEGTSSSTYTSNDVLGNKGRDCPFSTAPSGTSYFYTYDGDGNITSAYNGTATTYYGYNVDDQLCWAGASNGTNMTTTCPASPPGTDTAYNNDNDGNNTGPSSASITYSASANQATLINPIGGGTAITMTYTDQGNALRTAAGGNAEYNSFLGLTARLDGAGAPVYYTRMPNGTLLDEHGDTGTRYYLADSNSDITTLIKSDGTVAGSYTYTPFGNLTNTLTSDATKNPFRFAGGYQDIEGDNYYHFGARYYDPTLGRFTQQDPASESPNNPRSLNQYAYAGDDPANSSDPTGDFSLGGALSDVGDALEGVSAAGELAGGLTDAIEGNEPAVIGDIAGSVAGFLVGSACLAAVGGSTAGVAVGIGVGVCSVLGSGVGTIVSSDVTSAEEPTYL